MSLWTHVVGAIYIETFTDRKNIERYVKKKLKDAPKITGSENDCDVFVNALNEYNTFIYDNRKMEQYQTCVVLTIVGDLRDRNCEQVCREVDQFINYIESRANFDIMYKSIVVVDETDNKKIY